MTPTATLARLRFRVDGRWERSGVLALLASADHYEGVLLLAGLVALAAAWAPAYLERRPLSLPIVLVAIGMVLYALPIGLPLPDPLEHAEATERVTELGVLVALTGAGLGIDRPIGWRRWGSAWRLLGIAMPLTIGALALLSGAVLGLGAAAAVLLGAALAPTDPVLAADVQVGEPTVDAPEAEGEDGTAPTGGEHDVEDEVRVGLTAEAGLNDGLAFPFVMLAIWLGRPDAGDGWPVRWFLVDLLARVAVGVAVGVVVGVVLSRVFFDPPWRLSALADASDGFVALAATLLAYGVTELVGGYGFLAVFVAAVTVRSRERRHEYHRVLHGFASQVEHVIVVALLVLLGGVVVDGGLAGADLRVVAVALAAIFVVRPVAGRLAMIGSPAAPAERRALAFFGIRGIGSLYYVAYAVQRADIAGAATVWVTVVVTVLVSIAVHGVAATPVMLRLDRRRARAAARAKLRVDRRARRPSVAVATERRGWSDAPHVGEDRLVRRRGR